MLRKLTERIAAISNKVEDGHMSCLDGLIEINQIDKASKEVTELAKAFKDQFQGEIESQALEYNGNFKGYDISLRNGGKTFDYKGIAEWQTAQENLKCIEKKYKAMYNAFVTGSPNANSTIDGEVLALPEINNRKSSIIIKEIK